MLIPAHNEEINVGPTIESIVGQAYPSELFRIHVVADNCTDATAEEARRHGATVHERFDSAAPGKGPALRWLLDRVQADVDPPELVVILDADTVMAPGFLHAADDASGSGGSAWQAYYTVREPELSSGVALRHTALILRHLVRPLGRTAIGGSSGLYGNGMIFRAELLADRGFSDHLTEDVEFQLELLLEGHLVGFLPDAVVAAEMPIDLEAARTQNERWELGRLQLARRYIPTLMRRSLQSASTHRVALADATLDQLVPPLSVLAAGTALAAVGAATIGAGVQDRGRRGGILVVTCSAAALAFHVLGGLRLAGSTRSTYTALLHAPRLVAWKVALWLRMVLRPRNVKWERTARGTNQGEPGRSPDGPPGRPFSTLPPR